MKLSGKTALITGSSEGIGEALALRFAEEGADVELQRAMILGFRRMKTPFLNRMPFRSASPGRFP